MDVGQEIVAFASAAIDLSDGLVIDVQRILQGSGVGARIELETLPRSKVMQRQWQGGEDWNRVLAGGDDYELAFTAGPGTQCRDRHYKCGNRMPHYPDRAGHPRGIPWNCFSTVAATAA